VRTTLTQRRALRKQLAADGARIKADAVAGDVLAVLDDVDELIEALRDLHNMLNPHRLATSTRAILTELKLDAEAP
jgi:hypothetical protein